MSCYHSSEKLLRLSGASDFWLRLNTLGKRKAIDVLSVEDMKSFPKDFPGKFASLKSAYNLLVFGEDKITGSGVLNGSNFAFVPLKIEDCNACHDQSFSSCTCRTEQYDAGIACGLLYEKGMDGVLFNYLKENKIPTDPAQQLALGKLLTFFAKDRDCVVESDSIEFYDEGDVCLFLMNHLVTQLSVADEWKMDPQTKGKSSLMCPCSEEDCPMKNQTRDCFIDLSIGNTSVWHGCLDAMTFGQLPVVVMDAGGGDEQKDSAFRTKDQLCGETIVYSFLHSLCYGSEAFVPILGVKRGGVIVAMYDSALDVLLTSSEISLKASDHRVYSYASYLIIWLTCNFSYFSTPVHGKDLDWLKKYKAEFGKFAGEKLAIYQKCLRFQNARCKQNAIGLKLPDRETFWRKVEGCQLE